MNSAFELFIDIADKSFVVSLPISTMIRWILESRQPWRSMGIHRVPSDNFVVYYAVNDGSRTVTAIRIFYGIRNVEGIIQAEYEYPDYFTPRDPGLSFAQTH